MTVDETKKARSFVGIDALKLLETWIDSTSFDDFPTIDATAMAVLRAHVNEVRDLKTMTAWISHDRLRKHTRLSITAIKHAIERLDTAHLMKFHGYQERGIKVYQVTLPGITFTESTDVQPKKPSQSAYTRKTTATKEAASAWPGLEDSYE